MLADEPSRRKQVYVLIGNEPVESCMDRIKNGIGWGCGRPVQPYMKLNALDRQPAIRFDWTEQHLRRVARWANRRFWKYTTFENYCGSAKTSRMVGGRDIFEVRDA